MPADDPVIYFDLGSPYAYLALARARSVLGVQPELRPVLLGAIFARRGFGSWGRTEAREARIAEIEQRALRYGLPPVRWPRGWPANGLTAMRCASWACERGMGEAFARAVFDKQFVAAADIADLDVLLDCAGDAGLDVEALSAALKLPALKESLREASDRAWEEGVRGVPTLRVGELLFYGDDQLELAAEALRA
ncbi:MAG: 2-hydroxychromene-2-carboxylate isomerase [Solirubrobacterales bacterium]